MPIYLYIYIYFYAHVSLHYYTLLCPHSDICLYTTTSCVRPASVHVSVSPYTPHICLHTSTPIIILLSISSTAYLYILRYYYAHIPEHVHILRQTYTLFVYILICPHTYKCLHIHMPIYAILMIKYVYTHIRPIHIYMLLCSYTYSRLDTSMSLSIYVYIILRPYMHYNWLHASKIMTLFIVTYLNAHKLIYVFILLNTYTYTYLHT